MKSIYHIGEKIKYLITNSKTGQTYYLLDYAQQLETFLSSNLYWIRLSANQ